MKTSRQVTNASIVVDVLMHELGDVATNLLSLVTGRNGMVCIVNCSICTRFDQKATISIQLE